MDVVWRRPSRDWVAGPVHSVSPRRRRRRHHYFLAVSTLDRSFVRFFVASRPICPSPPPQQREERESSSRDAFLMVVVASLLLVLLLPSPILRLDTVPFFSSPSPTIATRGGSSRTTTAGEKEAVSSSSPPSPFSPLQSCRQNKWKKQEIHLISTARALKGCCCRLPGPYSPFCGRGKNVWKVCHIPLPPSLPPSPLPLPLSVSFPIPSDGILLANFYGPVEWRYV